jgi:hypothetical protein
MTEERETYGDYSVDDEDQLDSEDILADDDDPEDPLDAGYSPRERYSPDYGNTPWEEEHRETIDQRLSQEVPDTDPDAEWREDEPDREVGDRRAGRLVDPDEGVREDDESGLVGEDVGIDGAGASAEEAAVHIIDDEDDER